MPAKTLMVQGTASSVGKSIMVAALCRIFRQDGFRVTPFKAQNMALNSFVTREGGEIGRAQAVQAEAAGIEPSVHMNPVLLKPEADSRSQVIVLGKVANNLAASQYYDYTPYLLKVIEDSLNRLRASYDMVVIEGAGSPAEINLKEREIVNMRVAKMAGAPVLLVGDIDRGGVFAAIVGTLELLTQEERDLVKGVVINKFRGDIELLKPGLRSLEAKTGKPVLGIIPYFHDIAIAQEDSVYLDERPAQNNGGLDIAIIRLPHIANYDDFDPLEQSSVTVRYVATGTELDNPDLIILPGTKTTIADLAYLKQQGLDRAIVERAKGGTPVIGICGGYQMLGKNISDPDGVESGEGSIAGLGLLDIETTFHPTKTTTQVKARVAADTGLLKGLKGMEVTGYEIHMGQSNQNDLPVFKVIETPQGKAEYFDGSASPDGLIFGTYLHGLFHNTDFTSALLERLREVRGLPAAAATPLNKEAQYDKLAQLFRQNLDMTEVYRIALGGDYDEFFRHNIKVNKATG
ncbi:MAG: cobyric acid synthase [Chloroflexota bacterium]|nr:cobyric acid synthase [Chloroflexota bacterium]